MDKAEYQQKLDELTICVEDGDYKSALPIVEAIDWRRVKSVKTLNMVADVYEQNRNFEKMKEILMIAQTRTSIGRGVLSRLVDVCLRLGQVDQAEKYFHEFSKVAQNDNSRYVLQYKLFKAKDAPLDSQIKVLEEYREKEYTERWAYELAELYSRAGEEKKCVEACDDLILWFNEGKYVLKAMELKKQYEALTPNQEILYSRERDAEARRLREAAAAKAAEEAARKAEEEAARKAEEEAAKAAEEEEARAQEEKEAAEAAEAAEEAEGSDQFPKPTPTEEQKEVVFRFEPEDGEAPEDNRVPDASTEEEDEEEDGEENEVVTNRFLKGFHNVFGRRGDRKQEKTGYESAGEEPDEKELKVRELIPEEKAAAEPAEAPVREEAAPSEAAPAETETVPEEVPVQEKQPERNQDDFDLEGFLHEMEGAISEEIISGEYKEHRVTPVQEEIPTPQLSGTEKLIEAMDAAQAAEEEAARKADTEEISGTDKEFRAETRQTPAEDAVTESADPGTTQRENSEEVNNTAAESIQAAVESVVPAEALHQAAEELAAKAVPEKPKPKYNEELEIPDEEPTPEEKKAHTIPLGMIGQNTVPISIDKILSSETAEEQRIRILNRARPTRMNEEQRKTFTYFARIPGMDSQILEAISSVYEHAGERTSLHGNIGVMGARGTGKSRLSHGLIITMCKDMDLSAVKVARIKGDELNTKDPVRIVNLMSGGFLIIEEISRVNEQTLAKLNQSMEFRTDCMIVIIEDEKTAMRAFLKANPTFAAKFDKLISIPVFTNDELVTFARTYAAENDCQLDDLAILALYTKIGNQQSEDDPVTISVVRDMVDKAIDHSMRGRRRSKRVGKRGETSRLTILHEKDFE